MKWHLDELYGFIKKYIVIVEKDISIEKPLKEDLLGNLKRVIEHCESPDNSKENLQEILQILANLSTFLKSQPDFLQFSLMETSEATEFSRSGRQTLDNSDSPAAEQKNGQQQLLRMIDFYTVKISNHAGISHALSETYSSLFATVDDAEETLFFTLEQDGYRVYFSNLHNLEHFKLRLQDFNFNNLFTTIEANPPSMPGFEKHTQFLLIPHTQLGKLFAIFAKTENPQQYLHDIYVHAKLNPAKCRFYESRQRVFEEADCEFYKAYFEKFNEVEKNPLLDNFKEDIAFSKTDHRRYVGPLFELNRRFFDYSEDSSEETLSDELFNLLTGLKSILIIPENDETTGISLRLSNHFHKIYQMELEEKAPYVLFEKEGCVFYFVTYAALASVASQLSIHEIFNKPIFNDYNFREANHRVPKEFQHKMIVPASHNHRLLALGRIHPANIDLALKQAYENQGLNFTEMLLQSALTPTAVSCPTLQTSFSVAQLKNGEKIVRMCLEPNQPANSKSMGHVMLLLDDSASMEGGRIKAATQSCVQLIDALPADTLITVMPFNATSPNFSRINKSLLPNDWKKQILSIKATGGTPMLATIVAAAARISSHYFASMQEIKETTILLITDGDCNETAEEVLKAVQTGLHHGKDFSKCNHALGTPDLPNRASFPIIPIGIGDGYSATFVDGLGSFAGSYHIRDDENLGIDLQEMVASVKQSFGPKIGPLYVGLLDEKQNCVITVNIDMMLPATNRYIYKRLTANQETENLSTIICLETEHFASAARQVDLEEITILTGFFEAELDAFFEKLYALYATKIAPIQTNSRTSRFTPNPIEVPTPANMTVLLKPIKMELEKLILEIKENGITLPRILNQLEVLTDLINHPGKLFHRQDDLRGYQSRSTRRARGLMDAQDLALPSINTMIAVTTTTTTTTTTMTGSTNSAMFFNKKKVSSNSEEEIFMEPDKYSPTNSSWLMSFLINEIATQTTEHGKDCKKTLQLACVFQWFSERTFEHQQGLFPLINLIYSICSIKNNLLGITQPDSLKRFVRFCVENNWEYPKKPVFEESQLNVLITKESVSKFMHFVVFDDEPEEVKNEDSIGCTQQ